MKKLVYVKPDLTVDILTVEDKDFAISEGSVAPEEYRAQLASFEAMQEELQALVRTSAGVNSPAAKFLRTHGVWLANLSRTGFAIDYSQFVRD